MLGQNASGQLGLGDRTDRSSPTQIGAATWGRVAAGAANTYALH